LARSAGPAAATRTIVLTLVTIAFLLVTGCECECNDDCASCPSNPGHYCTGSCGDTCYYCPFGYSCDGDDCVRRGGFAAKEKRARSLPRNAEAGVACGSGEGDCP